MRDEKKTIEQIRTYLTQKYGFVKPEWDLILALLEDNLIIYNECREALDQDGVYDLTTGKKSPLLSTLKDLQATILKEIQHLGISPYAISKIKSGEENDEEDFIDALTK